MRQQGGNLRQRHRVAALITFPLRLLTDRDVLQRDYSFAAISVRRFCICGGQRDSPYRHPVPAARAFEIKLLLPSRSHLLCDLQIEARLGLNRAQARHLRRRQGQQPCGLRIREPDLAIAVGHQNPAGDRIQNALQRQPHASVFGETFTQSLVSLR